MRAWGGEGRKGEKAKSGDPLSTHAELKGPCSCRLGSRGAEQWSTAKLQGGSDGWHGTIFGRQQNLLAFLSANHTPHSNFDWTDTITDLKGNKSVKRNVSRSRRAWNLCVNTHRPTATGTLASATLCSLLPNLLLPGFLRATKRHFPNHNF